MAIKVQGTTVIDDSRNIINIGIATVGSLDVNKISSDGIDYGQANYVLTSGGPSGNISWKLVTDTGAGILDAVFVRQNGSNVGSGTATTFDFYENFSLTQPSTGIASVRLADTLNLGGLNITGVSTFGGNVYLGDNDKIVLGDGGDLEIFHDTSNSRIRDTGTGDLSLEGQNVIIKNAGSLASMADFTANSSVSLYFNGSKKFETISTGVTITNDLYTSGNVSVAGTIFENFNGTYWNVVTQADVGYGASQVPLNQYLGQLAFLDDYHPNGLRRDGGGSDDVVVSAGGTVGIGTDTIGVNGYALEVRGNVYFSNGGAGSDGLSMNNGGITGVNKLTFSDPGPGEGLVWGGGNGWEIYESPNDLTTNSAGNLQFVDSGSRILTLNTSGNAEFTGSVGINSTAPTEKLDVNGTTKTTQLIVSGVSTFGGNVNLGDNDRLRLGDGNDLQIYHDGSENYIDDAGVGSLLIRTLGNNNIALQNSTGAMLTANGGTGRVELYYDNSKKLETTGAGATVFGTLETQQLNVSGVSTFQGNVYLGDGDVLNIGDGNDLQIYHDGTNSIIDNTTGNLIIRNTAPGNVDSSIFIRARSDENSIIVNDDGSVELYYDNSKKFETTGIGVSISNGASTTATIAGPAELVLDPAAVGDNTGLVRIKGDLYVDGTTTQINSTSLEIADFIVGIASTATTDLLADGAGIKIGPDNTLLYKYNGGTNPSLQSSENLSVATGKVYQIGTTERLSADTLSLGTGTTIHSPSSSVLTLGTNGKERIRIDNVGDIDLNLSDGYEDEGILKFGRSDGTFREHFIRVFNSATAASNYMKFDVHNGNFTTGGLDDATTVLTLLGNGNVGIGTDNPSQLLHLERDTAHLILLKRTGGAPSEVTLRNEGNLAILSNNTNGIDFQVGATPFSAMRISASGVVGIGTDIAATSSGGSKLEAYSSGTSNTWRSRITSAVDGADKSAFIGVYGTTPVVAAHNRNLSAWETLYVNATSHTNGGNVVMKGDVGIGTALPTAKLDVDGSFRFTGTGTFENGNNTYGTSTALSAEFGVNTSAAGAIKLHGTTSGAYGLIQATTSNLHIDTVVGGTYLNFYDGSFISFGTGAGAESARFTGSTGTLTLGTTSATGTASQPLQVTGGAYVSGGVGIGVTNPTEKLDVSGTVKATKFTSTQATGTAPFTVSSTTVVTNLNADLLDGQQGSYYLDTSSTAQTKSGNLTVDQLITTNNGNSQNVRIGDDIWLGDMNASNTLRLRGQQDQTQAYIVFGTSNATSLGRSGTGPLTYGGDFVATGNVGVGVTNPTNTLTINGTNSDTTPILGLRSGNTALAINDGAQIAFGYNGTDDYQHFIQTRHNSGNLNNAIDFYVCDGTQNNTLTSGSIHTMSLVSGNVGINTTDPQYKLHVIGSFAATTKSFVIDHPTKEGMKLRHGSLEGPENGVYVRGRTQSSIIELPEYWTNLVDEDSITVNLTPIGRNASLHSVIDIVDNTVVVESASGDINCFYTVFAERKDVEKLEVEF